MSKKLCSCGFPQSSPIPHEHDRVDGYDAEKHSTMAAGGGCFMARLPELDRAIVRAVWGFIAFIPFCWWWGVEGFTLFSFLGTLYFVPVHWIYNKVMKDG